MVVEIVKSLRATNPAAAEKFVKSYLSDVASGVSILGWGVDG
jgi:hypothetical protein